MRKSEIATLVVYFLMIAFAIIVGITVVGKAISQFSPAGFNQFAFVIIVIIVGLLLNIVMLEVLHVIGGKLGGYKIVSVNILGLCFEKKLNKWSFKFKDFDGLTGETKLAPKKEKTNLRPFVWLPLFGYAAEIATCIVIYSLIGNGDKSNPLRWFAVVAILFIVLSSMIALYNLTPVRLDTMTDGYRMALLNKPVNVEALNELMRIDNLQREGKEVGDIKTFTEISEFTANLNLFAVYEHLNKGKFDEAEKLIDIMIADPKKIEPSTFNRMIAQKIYIQIMTKPVDEAKEVYNKLADDKMRRYIANDVSMESIRAYILIAGILEGSVGEIRYALSKKDKALKKTLPTRANIEEKMLKDALDKIYNLHPDWKEEKKENTAE